MELTVENDAHVQRLVDQFVAGERNRVMEHLSRCVWNYDIDSAADRESQRKDVADRCMLTLFVYKELVRRMWNVPNPLQRVYPADVKAFTDMIVELAQ